MGSARAGEPLDADGFQVVASCRFTVAGRLPAVWRVIAVEDRAVETLPAGIVHRITAEHAPGEHDCLLEGAWDGRTVSALGSRRLDTSSRTITELRRHTSEDHLVTIVLARRLLGGTHVTMTGAFRPAGGASINTDRLADARRSWAEELERRRATVLDALAAA